MKTLILSAIASLTLLATAQAHTAGHEGGFLETARHLLTQPDHLAMLLGALAVVALIAFKLLRTAKK